ncbi:hypothetical protein [Streptomyces sp. NPDC002547]
MTTYVRGSGPHIAEQVRPEPGSAEAERYAALATDPGSDWREATPDADPMDPPGDGGGEGESGPGVVQRPARSAPKADWLAYANAQDPADHSGLTKDQLIEQYGSDA